MRFPLSGESKSLPDVDDAARVALAALALCAAAMHQEQGCDLRSRCLLHPTQAFVWHLLDKPGEAARPFILSSDQAVVLLRDAVEHAKKAGLPWMETELVLTPSPQLAELVRRSQELAASSAEAGEGEG